MTTAQQFVDCSSNNPMPDLKAYAAAGHRHLCRKVSEGVGYHWFEGDAVADAAHRLGLTVGHYHWLRPDSSAVAQAAFFVASVKPHLAAGDWLMTDFERTYENGVAIPDGPDVERAAQLHAFNNYVRTKLPHNPLYVYTGNWYIADMGLHCQTECRRWPIIMSDYSGTATLPNPYSLRYVAWQFTDRAHVAGFSAPVDYNRWLAPVKHPPTHPNWSDTVTKDEVTALVRDEIAQAERAVQLGGDHGHWTTKEFPKFVKSDGNGVQDRLNQLEQTQRKP